MDAIYYNAINIIPQIGPKRFKLLGNYFDTMKQAFSASMEKLQKAGLPENIAKEFVCKRAEIDPEKEWQKLQDQRIEVVTIKDKKKYPKLLSEIYNPPALLYVRGKLKADLEFAVAIVGSRKVSNYGKQTTPDITRELTKAGVTIISGLAAGVDGLAHLEAVNLEKPTIAVLGTGVDPESIYPFSNKRLAQRIIETNGALISEYPIKTLALPNHFPARNRIISGLSLGTLVIEATIDSGALITARHALEQGREIFAIPGDIYRPNSQGTNNLIKLGAKLVTEASDILNELNLTQAKEFIEAKKVIPDTKEEALLLKYLSKEPIHLDKLKQKTGLDIKNVNQTLTMMEMKGKVRNLGGLMYVIA